ncbi:MAG: hypothetical protein AVDCRST_MAG85-663 [uncultured Solirubrobacteraceae bacterium]|uniref:Uncharacterized protein n=1 Tax=uncultured Solirubrobacteraceae bacterium TaxID=1162706 RepID=A0A6J4RZ01_9ACTN|nr:MAG: hypothetical protein AVDCRST_MAG85-663 [uncultured Solirubrobacteraceae bacterium]
MQLLVVTALVLWASGVLIVVAICRAAAIGDRATRPSGSPAYRDARFARGSDCVGIAPRCSAARQHKPVI